MHINASVNINIHPNEAGDINRQKKKSSIYEVEVAALNITQADWTDYQINWSIFPWIINL